MSARSGGSGDPRRLLLIIGGIVALASLLSPEDHTSETVVRLGSFHTGPTGGQGIFVAAEELGLDPTSFTSPWTELAGRADDLTLALLAPTHKLDESETRAFLRFLSRGGKALYVPSGLGLDTEIFADAKLRDLFDLRSRTARRIDGDPDIRARRSAAISARAERILGDTPAKLRGVQRSIGQGSRRRQSTPLGTDLPELGPPTEVWIEDGSGNPVLARWEINAGELFLLSELDGLANGALAEGDLGPVLLRLMAELSTDRELAFDDFHHGLRSGQGPSATILRYLKSQPLGLSVLGWLLLALFALWGAGVRYGPPQPAPPAPRRSSLEHARALARAFSQAGATDVPAERLAEGARRRLAPLSFSEAVKRARQRGGDEDQLQSLSRRLSQQPPAVSSSADLARFARELDHLEEVLESSPR